MKAGVRGHNDTVAQMLTHTLPLVDAGVMVWQVRCPHFEHVDES